MITIDQTPIEVFHVGDILTAYRQLPAAPTYIYKILHLDLLKGYVTISSTKCVNTTTLEEFEQNFAEDLASRTATTEIPYLLSVLHHKIIFNENH